MPKKIKEPSIKGIAQVPTDKLTVIKSNPLSSLWRSELTLSEFKVLDVYLSRINSHLPERRQVEISKEEFENVFGISKFNIKELDARLEHLVGQAVRITDSDYKKGFAWISLFEEARVDFDDDGVQTVYLECTQKAMKYFFNCDNLGYLRYKLRSVKDMKSRYTYILFLYLEKHRNRGLEWEEKLDNLKIFLNCETDDIYKEFKYFNQRILQRCQKEILEKTECRFSYEPIKKGRKVTAIRFSLDSLQSIISAETVTDVINLQEQEQLKGQTTIDDFIPNVEQEEIDYGSELCELIGSSACDDEFSVEQVRLLADMVIKIIPQNDNLKRCNFMVEQMHKLDYYNTRKPIENRFEYLKNMLQNERGVVRGEKK